MASDFGKMFSGFILVLIGLILTPTVSTAAADAVTTANTTAEKAVLGLVGTLWVIGILAAAGKVAGIKFSG